MDTECILAVSNAWATAGYGRMTNPRTGHTENMHRIAWEDANQACLVKGTAVMHLCDTPRCINPKHLALGTKGLNNKDRNAKGRQAKGERHGSVKLTALQVVNIQSSGAPSSELAALFGVQPGTIRSIRRGATWKYLK